VLIHGQRHSIGNDCSRTLKLEAFARRYTAAEDFSPFTVRFNEAGRVSTVERDPETLARVFAR